MPKIKLGLKMNVSQFFIIWILIFVNTDMGVVHAHGGKVHEGNSFTAFQALQKATALYDRLIESGKLDTTWETALRSIELDTRMSTDGVETRVGFSRKAGSPESVYIFFSPDGNYSGSNFDGKW